MRGAVYILENLAAQRIKVGMTISDVKLRLRDANAMWLELKITCQICGARRLVKLNLRTPHAPRVVPRHSASGVDCPGGSERPLEQDTSLAREHLDYLKRRVDQLSGSKKASMTRQINTLEERLTLRSQHVRGVGKWTIGTVYYTDCAEQAELLSHEYLAEYLDRHAPFGEVFNCSISVAREAVEMALKNLGVLDGARREDPYLIEIVANSMAL